MIRNYFKVAIRNLTRHKFFSFINIFGLSISMSVCLGIIMLVADQLSYDRHNAKADKIFRVNTQYTFSDGTPSGIDYATTPMPIGEALKKEYTGVEKAVRIRRGFGNDWIEFGQDKNIPLAGFFADPEALDLFELTLEYGDAKSALVEPNSVVITKKAAKKLFKQENPVGEIIKVGDLGEYTVTGVIEEKNQKSHIVFEALASFSSVKSLEADSTLRGNFNNWGDWTTGWVYIQLENDKDQKDIQAHLNDIATKHFPTAHGFQKDMKYKFYLQNLTSITPGPMIGNAIGPFMPMLFVYFFGGFALIVMLTSCFNYTNLSIARSLTRAREIGVRKVNGAMRLQIFSQFLSESILVALFSLVMAIGMLVVVKPFLMSMKFASFLHWDLAANTSVYIAFLVFSLVIGILAGLFPAVVLSRFEPIRVLKNISNMKLFSKIGLRKSLLVIQFSLSLIFIISVLIVKSQLNLFLTADLGFESKDNIVLQLNDLPYKNLKTEIEANSNIINVSASSHVPASGTSYGADIKRNLGDESGVSLNYYLVDANYLENLDIELISGRFFTEEAGESNKNFIVLNEKAVEAFQLNTATEAIGTVLFFDQDSTAVEVIGVVKDYNHQVLMTQIEPMALRYDANRFHILQVKHNGNYEEAKGAIEAAWTKINPTLTISYKSMDEEIRFFYETIFSDIVSIVGIVSAMAIAISCLGLLGMATYTIESKMKEISIRKVLGSSNKSLVLHLSKDFLILLVISIGIAVPLAWLLNNSWLQLIAFRTEISVGIIILGVSVLVVLGVITIGSQTIRAAFTNPVDNLKNE